MLEIKNLNKSYGSNLVLKDINLNIEKDKIYGLLGRNGVGKTTLLNLISNQIIRNSGEIIYAGEEIFENPVAIENICLVKIFPEAIKERKVKDLLEMAKIMYKNWDEEYKNQLVKEFNLDTKKKLHKLSTGNKTIVGLIIGLAARAEISMFDEPTLGLDAALRYKFYNLLLADYELNPRTIIISTHLIDEVANLFEEVIILNDSSIALKDEVSNLKERAHFLSGNEAAINEIIINKQVIYQETLGNTKIVGIYEEVSDKEKQGIKAQNIEISSIPLQKLFIYLTENMFKEAI